MQVWIAVHDHKEGTDVGVYESEDAAYAKMARLIRKFYWKEAFEQADENTEIIAADPPADDRECVEEYFNVMGEQFEAEWIDIDVRDVQTMEAIQANA